MLRMVYHLQSWLHVVSIDRNPTPTQQLASLRYNNKNCNLSRTELERSLWICCTTIFIFLRTLYVLRQPLWSYLSLSFFALGEGWGGLLGVGVLGALTRETLQLDPAKASNYPAVPTHCQHASSSPISVEGDILHAVLIKQWHAAEAAKCSWGASNERKWDVINAW